MTARRGAELAALAAGLVLLVVAAFQIDRASRTNMAADLVVDHRTARAFLDGYNPFSAEGAERAGLTELGPTGLGHPPTTSFWLLPLGRASLQTARQVLAWLSFGTLLAQVLIAAALLGWSRGPALLVAGFVAGTPVFLYLVTLGQVSQLIAFLCFAAWWALRRGRPVVAGAALGAACTFKLFPGVLVLWLVLERRWRALAAAAGVWLVVAAVMTARFGFDSWRVFLVAQGEVANAWVADVSNQSLHGVFQRLWASPACELPGRVAPEALALSALVSVGLLALAWKRTRAAGLDLGFACFALLSVLTSQWAWPHYAVLLVLPAMIAATLLRGADRPLKWAGAVVLAGLAVTWRLDVRAPAALQNALWAGDRSAHLPLHLVEVLGWLPAVLLLIVALRLTRAARPA
jgi:alpha-1,2-mannosyltransferase